MNRKNVSFLFAMFMIFMYSCKTDFDINANWKDITIVYCILNQNDTIHYAKINKAFLGNESAYTMAQESDSFNYSDINVTLTAFKVNNNDTSWYETSTMTKNTSIPKDTLSITGEPGVFSTSNNIIYTSDLKLKNDREYQLKIQIPDKNKVVYSNTNLIEGLIVKQPTTTPQQKIGFSGELGEYYDYTVEWTSAANALLYGLTLVIHYDEIHADSTVHKSISWNLPNVEASDFDGGEKLKREISGESFFNYINNSISTGNDPDILRDLKGIDFVFVVAGEELSTYINVYGPSNSVVQERPVFTNITNGIGVFSSRFDKTIEGKQLSNHSLDELACGQFTKHLRFKGSNGKICND